MNEIKSNAIEKKVVQLFAEFLFLDIMIAITLSVGVMTIFEIGIALHLGFAHDFANLGLKVGSALWILLTIFSSWVEFFGNKTREQDQLQLREKVLMTLTMAAFAVCTQASIHWGLFVSLSNWTNAAISVLVFVTIIVTGIPEARKSIANFKA